MSQGPACGTPLERRGGGFIGRVQPTEATIIVATSIATINLATLGAMPTPRRIILLPRCETLVGG